MNFGLNARLQNGLMIQGGAGTGRVVTDDCDVVAALPETLHANFFTGNPANPVTTSRSFAAAARTLERCRQDHGWRTSMQGMVAYVLPKIDVNVSGTFQDLPGSSTSNSTGTSMSANAAIAAAPRHSDGRTAAGRMRGSSTSSRPARLRRADEAAGPPHVQALPGGDDADQRQLRLLQRAQFQLRDQREHHVRSYWRTPQLILLPRIFKLSAQFDF